MACWIYKKTKKADEQTASSEHWRNATSARVKIAQAISNLPNEQKQFRIGKAI